MQNLWPTPVLQYNSIAHSQWQNGLAPAYNTFPILDLQTPFSSSKDYYPHLVTNLFLIKKASLFPDVMSKLEYRKQVNVVGVGITGSITLPLIRENRWSLYLNGRVSSSYYHIDPHQQKNRWNFEHQIGGEANYRFNKKFQVSLGTYHFRIVNDYQYENPTKAYIKSNGGIMTFRLQY